MKSPYSSSPWAPAVACLVAAFPARSVETSPVQFVREYLREFGAIEHIRLAEELELQAPHQSMLSTCLESGNRFRLEISQQSEHMRGMSLPPPSQALPLRLAALYDRKLEIYTEVIRACTALEKGTSTNVTPFEVISAISRYNGKVDTIDRLLFETSTDAFTTLLSTTPGAPNKPRRLRITLAEKQSLLQQIHSEFGAELDDDQQTYLVNAATVIRDALRSHRAADED